VKRSAPIRVASFFLCAACAALSQSERPSPVVTQQAHSYSPLDTQRQELRTPTSIPYAPSVQPPTPAERLPTFIDTLRSPLTPAVFAFNVDVMRETELGQVSHRPRPAFTVSYKEPNTFLDRYLDRSLVSQNLRYPRSASVTFMGRATYAASRIFITRDAAGRRRLNTPYFLEVLSLIAVHTAKSPYWTRSASAPFSDLGSTMGNDAGINLFHEFGPGIQQAVKGHTPRFLFKIGERIIRDRNARGTISMPAR
jgi:hypothetical protein